MAVPVLSPVRLERRGDELRASLTIAAASGPRITVSARVSVSGAMVDWQSESAGGFMSCSTGDAELDGLALDAIERAWVSAHNAVVVGELDRQLRSRGR